MRGKPGCRCFPRRTIRIIPARAGQTSARTRRVGRVPDHPRACGANSHNRFMSAMVSGSSPRVRGKPADKVDADDATPDHPRACGANRKSGFDSLPGDGSSPRVRGKLLGGFIVHCRVRIIPARAGQTPAPAASRRSGSDHPRACGANNDRVDVHASTAGSSPRVRGKRRVEQQRGPGERIIPARAGQTHPRSRIRCTSPDHPRACGANMFACGHGGYPFGSSPRVRGKPNGSRHIGCNDRIIPARAGQTLAWREERFSEPDHPRACGANSPILCENS